MMLVSLIRIGSLLSRLNREAVCQRESGDASRKLRKADGGRLPISERQPGKSARGSFPGTEIMARARRRYPDGVSPTRRVKRSLKLPRLEKPTSRHTSVTERPPAASRRLAKSRRGCIRYWCGV